MNLEFKTLFYWLFFSFVLSFIISIASIILSNKTPDKEKVSVYECGFNPINMPGQPFSIRFFLIGVLFLIFDLEITYLFPWSVSSNIVSLKGQWVIIIFIICLVIGLIYEWVKGGLEWE